MKAGDTDKLIRSLHIFWFGQW